MLRYSRCELWLLETGSWGQGQIRNPEEGERPPLEAVTRRLVNTQEAEKSYVCSSEL
jgi:hypothetical protein